MPLSDTLLHRIHGNVVVIASYGQMRLCGESREHMSRACEAPEAAALGLQEGCRLLVPWAAEL